MMILSGTDSADFTFLEKTLGLTKGNLSAHMARLEAADYVEVTKTFRGKMPNTSYRLTPQGRSGLNAYWEAIDDIRSES